MSKWVVPSYSKVRAWRNVYTKVHDETRERWRAPSYVGYIRRYRMRRPFSIARFLQRQDKRGARPRRIDRESRTKRIHSSGGGKRGEIGEVPSFFFFRIIPRASISALPSAPSDESTSHHQCQYRLGYLVERTTMGEARGRTRGCWTHTD